MSDVRAHLIIAGRVQGVWFRESTRQEAKGLGLTGWVRNLLTGDVEAVVEGEESQVERLIEWAKVGPPVARVTRVDVRRFETTGEFSDFRVVH